MSDNKKYYYLKLKEHFFDTEALVLLESMTDGYLYSNILLKLYLKSLKNNGKLMFNNMIPYNANMLASVTRHNVGVIEKALDIFEKLGLIEVLTNGEIYMTDIQNFIGKSSTESDRKREYRRRINEEKQKLGQMSGQCPLELEKDIEKDIEIDIEIEKEKKHAHSLALSSNSSLSQLSQEQYNDLIKKYPVDLVNRTVEKAQKYKGCNTLDTIEKWIKEKIEQPNEIKKVNRFNNVHQRNYDQEELDELERRWLSQ